MGLDAFGRLKQSLEQLKQEKPNDRSEIDRRYAIAITELEKVIAYVSVYIEDAIQAELDKEG